MTTTAMPWIGEDDYTVGPAFDGDGVVCTYTPLGVSGWGDDIREAYSAMLRAIRSHISK